MNAHLWRHLELAASAPAIAGSWDGGARDWGGRYPGGVQEAGAPGVGATIVTPQGLFARSKSKADTPTTRHPPLNVAIPDSLWKRKKTAWHTIIHHRLVEAAPFYCKVVHDITARNTGRTTEHSNLCGRTEDYMIAIAWATRTIPLITKAIAVPTGGLRMYRTRTDVIAPCE